MSKTLILLICIFALWMIISATDKISEKDSDKKEKFADDDVKYTEYRGQRIPLINEVTI